MVATPENGRSTPDMVSTDPSGSPSLARTGITTGSSSPVCATSSVALQPKPVAAITCGLAAPLWSILSTASWGPVEEGANARLPRAALP